MAYFEENAERLIDIGIGTFRLGTGHTSELLVFPTSWWNRNRENRVYELI